jgi:hypothetical protein
MSVMWSTRSLIVAAVVAAATAANAQADFEAPDCTGTVVRLQDSVTLDPHGDEICSPKWVTGLNSKFGKQILKTCPFGSHCHIEGGYSNHGIEEITKVVRIRR